MLYDSLMRIDLSLTTYQQDSYTTGLHCALQKDNNDRPNRKKVMLIKLHQHDNGRWSCVYTIVQL